MLHTLLILLLIFYFFWVVLVVNIKKCLLQVFVTGGIGGVHRGAAQTMDISADLTELGRQNRNTLTIVK